MVAGHLSGDPLLLRAGYQVIHEDPEATLARRTERLDQLDQVVDAVHRFDHDRQFGQLGSPDVLQQLGDPTTLAESYLSAVPLVSASFLQRGLAKFIDVFMVVLTAMLFVGLPVWVAGHQEWPFLFGFGVVLMVLAATFGFGLYTIVAEHWLGFTLGKRALGLRVVRESGAPIGLGQSIVRQLPMFLQVYWIDVLFALFTDKSQRAFELLSKTRVVTETRAT